MTFLSVLFGILISASMAFAGDFGAIAYSRSINKSGVSNNRKTLNDAKDAALQACGAPDCEIAISGQNSFFSLASSEENEIGVGAGESIGAAVQTAYAACREKSKTCRWRLYVGSHGEIGERYVVAEKGPLTPKLEDIGGPFSKTIEHFGAFRQLQEQWCWAAVAQSIYYGLTGARVNQSLLARITVDPDENDFSSMDRRESVRDLVCAGEAGKRKACNQAGYPGTALKVLGVSAPATETPGPMDAEAIYSKIRESLQKNIPVGIVITWYSGHSHAIVVYGADYSLNKNSGEGLAQISLKVFDPADGGFYVMNSNRYLPNYQIIPGVFTGWMTLTNYKSATVHRVQPRACEFMERSQRRMFCSNFSAAGDARYPF